MKSQLICNSCKTELTNNIGSVQFKCPNCGKFELIRCAHCREIVAKYKCPECGFTGPN
ncbi:MAG: zinc finger domain-containing protein [Candidatus Woesearchaeota archaeon]